MAKRKMAAECEDFEEFYWPARCRGYLEGKRASDCLANVELARLRAENERLRAALAPFAVVADYLPDDLPADTVALTTPDEFQPWDIRAKYVYGARAALKAEP